MKKSANIIFEVQAEEEELKREATVEMIENESMYGLDSMASGAVMASGKQRSIASEA